MVREDGRERCGSIDKANDREYLLRVSYMEVYNEVSEVSTCA